MASAQSHVPVRYYDYYRLHCSHSSWLSKRCTAWSMVYKLSTEVNFFDWIILSMFNKRTDFSAPFDINTTSGYIKSHLMYFPCMNIYFFTHAISAEFFVIIILYLNTFCRDFQNVCEHHMGDGGKGNVLFVVKYYEFISM